MRSAVLLLAMAAALDAAPSAACSTFYLGSDKPVFGKNYDWDVDVGILVVNKRGVAKVALAGDNPARWVSKYGSVTFNQYGRELPSGGMNEAGLVVELMWLDDSEYPAPDSRSAIGNMQWIQYQLDNAATVDEVLASDSMVRIEPGGAAKIHYLVADAGGGCATVEFIDGALAAHTGERLPWCVLTNDTYASSLEYLGTLEGFGGDRPPPGDGSSYGRFATAADFLARYDGSTPGVEYAFDMLRRVAQGDYTQWSIVYDIEAGRIHFRTRANARIRSVDLAKLRFDCATPVLVLDVNADGHGDLSGAFAPYSVEANLEVIRDAFQRTSFLKAVPRETRERLARYPQSLDCVTIPHEAGE